MSSKNNKTKDEFISISEKLKQMNEAKIHTINDRIRALRNNNVKVYDYGQALINMPPPLSISKFLNSCDWADPALFKLCPVPGLDSLRSKIANYRKEIFKEKITAENVIITNGANHAVLLALKAITEPKSEKIALISPYFFNHLMSIQSEDCDPYYLSLNANLELDMRSIEQQWEVNTRALLLANPLNPSGGVLSSKDLSQLASYTHIQKTVLILDETYFEFQKNKTNVKLNNESTILIGSFSKSLCLAGMRIGYLIAPKNVIQEIIKLQDASIISPSTIGQHCVDVGLDDMKVFIPQIKKELYERNEILRSGLQSLNFFTQIHGDIDLFCFSKLPEKAENDVTFANSLIDDAHISVMPGNISGQMGKGYIRWSVGAISKNDIENSIPIIKKFIEDISK